MRDDLRCLKQDAHGQIIPSPKPSPLRRLIRLVDRPVPIKPKAKPKPLALRLLAAGMAAVNAPQQVTR